MVALTTISFILSAFPLFMGCISLPIFLVQKFLAEQGWDKEKQLVRQAKTKAWFYGLWLPTAIWTVAFVIYKAWTYMFLYDVALIEPLDYCGGIFFVIFYVLFHWGYLAYSKKENLGNTYDATHVFKIVLSFLLFFVVLLLFSFFYCLIKLRF